VLNLNETRVLGSRFRVSFGNSFFPLIETSRVLEKRPTKRTRRRVINRVKIEFGVKKRNIDLFSLANNKRFIVDGGASRSSVLKD